MSMPIGCLSLFVAMVLMLVMPFVYADLMQAALLKLQISPQAAALIVAGIFIGSLVNIPVKRVARDRTVPVHPLAVFGLGGWWPDMTRTRAETVVAVNVGGCLIPTGLATYEVLQLARTDAVLALLGAVLLNVAVCYALARPVRGVGIQMPGLIPPLVAAASALLLAPAYATPVAFVAGTTGPLVGADLLHIRQMDQMDAGMLSIGGAGTLDGILLSGIVALYLS
jgi:uncharacterized membrane protein